MGLTDKVIGQKFTNFHPLARVRQRGNSLQRSSALATVYATGVPGGWLWWKTRKLQGWQE